MHRRQSGFSLVELSIVLVILGLLIGGVLSGRHLIRASQLRSVITEYQNFYRAHQAFREKYFALPGDMPNATQFWGQIAATGAACKAAPSADARTCDGSGDGTVNTTYSGSNETLRYWQHLANAGLIAGKYCGAAVGCTLPTLPVGKINTSYWYFRYELMQYYTGVVSSENGNILRFSSTTTPLSSLSGTEAFNIDTKLDDGKPLTGKVIQYAGLTTDWTTCTDGIITASYRDATQPTNYRLDTSDRVCELWFRKQF